MNLKDSVQFEFGSVIGLLKREMESGPITDLYLNLICNKQLARECKQIACEPSLSSIFVQAYYSILADQDAGSYRERTGPPGPGLLALLPFLLPPYSLPLSLPWSMLLLLCLILSPSEL